MQPNGDIWPEQKNTSFEKKNTSQATNLAKL